MRRLLDPGDRLMLLPGNLCWSPSGPHSLAPSSPHSLATPACPLAGAALVTEAPRENTLPLWSPHMLVRPEIASPASNSRLWPTTSSLVSLGDSRTQGDQTRPYLQDKMRFINKSHLIRISVNTSAVALTSTPLIQPCSRKRLR